MNDHQMPMFEEPSPPLADAPKKERRKPVKRRKARKAAAKAETPAAPPAPKKRRKIRVANGHAGGRYTKEQYRVIGALMNMSLKERTAVFDIVKGLSK